MQKTQLLTSGKKLTEAKKALVMVHGRGASAEDIISLAGYLNVEDYALIAPQAPNYTWYPYSFLVPPSQNEPQLTASLNLLKEVVEDINEAGISDHHIYFLGFSQGACLAVEFVTRNAKK